MIVRDKFFRLLKLYGIGYLAGIIISETAAYFRNEGSPALNAYYLGEIAVIAVPIFIISFLIFAIYSGAISHENNSDE